MLAVRFSGVPRNWEHKGRFFGTALYLFSAFREWFGEKRPGPSASALLRLLRCFSWLIPCSVLICRAVTVGFFDGWPQAVLGGFFAVEDGAAGFAHGYAVLDFFGADGAFGERLGIVEPRLFEVEFASGAAFEVGDEHGIVRALPLEVGGGDEATLKLLKAAARFGEFTFCGRFASSD